MHTNFRSTATNYNRPHSNSSAESQRTNDGDEEEEEENEESTDDVANATLPNPPAETPSKYICWNHTKKTHATQKRGFFEEAKVHYLNSGKNNYFSEL